MSRLAVIAALLGVLGAGLFLFSPGGRVDPQAASAPAAPPESKIVRHAFLDDLDLDVPGSDYAILLHEQATGGDMRVVLDKEVIRAAQGKAFFTDDPTTATKRMLLSIVFLSPPGNPPNSSFVSIIRNKEITQTYGCYVSYCNGSYPSETPHTRDLAGLLEASQPVRFVARKFAHHDQARAAHFRALRDPRVVHIIPPDLPAPSTRVYPDALLLSLPAQLIEVDPETKEPLTPFDETEFMARFTAAFEYAYPDKEAYRLGPLRVLTQYPPHSGWPIVSEEIETRYLQDDAGGRLGLPDIMVVEPRLTIDLIPDMAQRLLGPDAFEAMPDFAREPVNLAARLDTLAEEVLGRPCAGCFQIELQVSTVDKIKVERRDPVSYSLFHYEIAPDEPAAQ